jgi:serine/threonine protein kinase
MAGVQTPVRKRIDLLLAAHALTDPLLDTNAAEWLGLKTQSIPTQPTADVIAALQPFLEPTSRPNGVGRLGHYELIATLGRGGFGLVFKAFDERLHRVVAIKVLLPHLASASPHRQRFLREARAAAAIRHESVVQIYAVEESPLPFLVMEYCEGSTLQDHLRSIGPFEPGEVVRLGTQIALGLAAAHDRGLTHRDVKPSNVILEVGRISRAKLTDFGLAQAVDDADPVTMAGSPEYMSPEQVRGEVVGPRSDQFSLGSVLYAMCVGHPPFRDANPLGVLQRVARDAPEPIRKIVPDVPEPLSAVIARLHRKDPAERFATSHDVADALSRCVPEPPSKSRQIPRRLRIAGALLAAVGLLAFVLTPSVRDHLPKEAFPQREASWEETVAAQPIGQQVEAVRRRLKERNPAFDESKVAFEVTDGSVQKVVFNGTAHLFDMSPLHAFPRLKVLDLNGSGVTDLKTLRGLKLTTLSSNGNPIKDLSPIADMPLEYVGIWGGACPDLSPLQGKMLRGANFGDGPIRDITPLNGMPITMLCLNHTPLQDISPLKSMPLRRLELSNTSVSDLSPLKDAPIESLTLTGSPIKDYDVLITMRHLNDLRFDYDPVRHRNILRSIPSLKFVNGKPVGEVVLTPFPAHLR